MSMQCVCVSRPVFVPVLSHSACSFPFTPFCKQQADNVTPLIGEQYCAVGACGVIAFVLCPVLNNLHILRYVDVLYTMNQLTFIDFNNIII